jgi:HEAT repeat protein
MTLAPLLRLLLHPQLVSAAETRAHLIELGEAAIPALQAARSEKALEPLCVAILEAIGRPDGRAPAPRFDADPDRAMWLRFVAEQLVERHPYDPELGFGERLYLFGERAVPALVEHLDHEHAFLRRNAVVVLERIGGRVALEALTAALERTRDPVQWCRIALALGRRRYVPALDPLLAQLGSEREPWRLAVLFHAVGSLGESRAAPAIPRRAAAHARDADLTMAALVALARLPQREVPESVGKYLDAVRGVAAAIWRQDGPPPGYSPDRPDDPSARHEALLQLVRVARSASDFTDGESAAELLSWLGPADRAAALLPPRALTGDGGALARVAAPSRLVYLEQLARLGEKGRLALLEVARDGRTEAQLRAQALRHAPSEERAALAAEIAVDERVEGSLRIAALEILSGLRDRALGSVALRIARQVLAEPDLDALDAAERFLLRRAIEALGSTGGEAALEVLLACASRPAAAAPPSAKLEQALRSQVAALVATVAEKRSVRAVAREIEDLVDLVVAKRLSPVYRVDNRARAIERVTALLDGSRTNQEPRYLALVTESIANELLGRVLAGGESAVVFAPRVPLGDVLCFELARRSEPTAQLALLRRLRHDDAVERGHAALALGGVPPRVGGAHLLQALLDREPFVRLCAAVALERLCGIPNACDWWRGSDANRAAAVERFRAALELRR